MFEHRLFHIYDFTSIPLGKDIFVVDEKWMHDWEAAMVDMFNGGEYRAVGYISWAAVRSTRRTALELSWFANTHTRFHEVKLILPRDAFVNYVECDEYDERPHLFVKGKW